jgi:hypothetical protein
MKRIYVAGASTEAALISDCMRKLESAGYVITEDWTKSVIANRNEGKTDAALTLEEMTIFASNDRGGVLSADMFWLVIPTGKSVGCWVELGMAIAHAIPSVVSGVWEGKIFCALADQRCATHDEALQMLMGAI